VSDIFETKLVLLFVVGVDLFVLDADLKLGRLVVTDDDDDDDEEATTADDEPSRTFLLLDLSIFKCFLIELVGVARNCCLLLLLLKLLLLLEFKDKISFFFERLAELVSVLDRDDELDEHESEGTDNEFVVKLDTVESSDVISFRLELKKG